MDKQPAVYILSNQRRGTLYIGVTSQLIRRIHEHKSGAAPGFTKKYQLHHLVWYELHDSMYAAIEREKRLKKWHRQWKIELIERLNPQWIDLYPGLTAPN